MLIYDAGNRLSKFKIFATEVGLEVKVIYCLLLHSETNYYENVLWLSIKIDEDC